MFEKMTKAMMENIIDNHAIWGEETDRYINTGYIDLDYRIGGFRKGETYLLAGDINIGHMAFAMNLIRNIAIKAKKRVLYVALKESVEQTIKYMAQIIGEVDQISFCSMSKEDMKNRLAASIKLIDDSEIYICNGAGLTVQEIEEEVNDFGLQFDLLIIDSLNEISHDIGLGKSKHLAIRNLEDIKGLAVIKNCPVLVLNDIDEIIGLDGDNRPAVDAFANRKLVRSVDNIFFVYRDDYYDRESEHKGIAEIIVAQNRHGMAGTVKLAYDENCAKFSTLG